MRYALVTTMNAQGWNETGRRMVESVIEHWPTSALPITVYADGFDPPELPAMEVRRLPEWLDEFKAEHSANPARTGQLPRGYDYRFDAVKFAHKVAALTDFAVSVQEDVIVIWLDADTVTHSTVKEEWLDSLLPESAYLAWLDRNNSHPECGFVMFRASHPYHQNFMEAFRNLYTSGELFRLRETHDSYALQHVVTAKVMNRKISPPASLSGAARATSHPFVNGPLSVCFDHMKGPRKRIGRTPKEQRRLIKDGHPYWT